MCEKKEYGQFTTDDLKAILLLLPQLERERRELRVKIAEETEKFSEKFLTTGFTWAHLYETPFPQLLAGFRAVAGVDEVLVQASKQEVPVKALLGIPDVLQDTEWTGGTGGHYKPGDLLGYLHAVVGNLDCLLIYGSYLCDLIARAKEGDMTSLLNAIRIDPSVVSGPTGSFFISLSVIEGDREFLGKVSAALLGKTGKQSAILKNFRYLMQLLHELDELGRPTKEIMGLVFDLDIYCREPGAEKNVSELIRKARTLKKNTISK